MMVELGIMFERSDGEGGLGGKVMLSGLRVLIVGYWMRMRMR